jgi:hypothetical protein
MTAEPTIKVRFTTFVRRRFKFSIHNRAAWSAAQATGCAGSQRDRRNGRDASARLRSARRSRSDPVSALFALGTTQPGRSRSSKFLAQVPRTRDKHSHQSQNDRAVCTRYQRRARSGRARKRACAHGIRARAAEAYQSMRDYIHACYFRMCRQRAAARNATGSGLADGCGSPEVSHRPRVAGAAARAGLRFRPVRTENRGSRPMGASEARIRAKMLPACGEDGSRTAAAIASGDQPMRDRASVPLGEILSRN